ncbi:BlaI/MecI/CopY family transcriptional regulator [Sphingomicrobium clamense]|uniref:BlaI/MecI/CopY family transcriptional regulator n=1 Tax=Sphingomicrobium clamense TaxID=2851013 RepID=A0ABS6V4V9_9SPHN|nr:BlaI/MecI/CopY family transcriptional regulator [Sphingomicrobium sp. B8]MBW0144589.1 BlaI/MecI/CopY family transcriptional regulator [Sphingomicrobium sp. B8]
MTKRISEAELDVMEALWGHSAALTATEVAERVPQERGWSLPTVKTMLSRLVAKNAVRHEQDGRRYLYSPAIERADYVGGESKRMVERLFGGKLSPLVAHLAESDSLDAEDVAEIEKLLKALKK